MPDLQIDILIDAIKARKDPTVVGLDTRIDYIPPEMTKGLSPTEAILAYDKSIVDAVADIIPAAKIQIAYFEMLGPDGIDLLKETISIVRRSGMSVILDAKRGDIGSTASAYSEAYLKDGAELASDFLTVNPYFGTDGVKPFIDDCASTGRGLFVLVKTSNPSSGELQDILTDDGRPLYERVADRVKSWGSGTIGRHGYSSIGAVVGATYPEQGASLRRSMPNTFFLVPGYGAQGASAKDISGCFDGEGSGAIVNASRSILLAYRKHGGTPADAARKEAIRMRDDIASAIKI